MLTGTHPAFAQIEAGQSVRIQHVDGGTIMGEVLSLADADLFVADDASGRNVQVFAHEVVALDVTQPRRVLQWTLALLAIPAVVAFLVAFMQLPLPFSDRTGAMTGLAVLFAIGWMLFSRRSVRRLLERWLTTWQRVYP